MKLSLILLLGANLVAVPCASAADGDWLRANLAEMNQQVQSTKQAAATTKAKATHAEGRILQSASTAAKPKVMLRAFQPGRVLPRKRDLVAQYAQIDNSMSPGLTAQQPTADQSQLTGRVCAFQQPAYDAQQPSAYQTWANVAARAAKNEAITRPFKSAAKNVMAKAPAGLIPPGLASAMPIQTHVQQQMVAALPPAAAIPAPLQMPAPAAVCEQPIFSAEDEAAFNRILSGNFCGAGNSTGDMTKRTGNPAPGAGQAPFPLNLLFGSSGPNSTQKPANPLMGKPKFGQWHPKGQLAYGGFGKSNIAHGKRRKRNVMRQAPAPVSTRRQASVAARKRPIAPAVVQASPAIKMPATVAQYPPYTTSYPRPF